MKRYHFHIEKVLNLREFHEKEREMDLARAAGECVRVRSSINDHIYEKAKAILSRRIKGEVDIEGLMRSELYIRRLSDEEVKLGQDLVVKEQARLEAQKKFIDASRERKVLSKLKERREGEFYKKERSEEMKRIDDMNNSAYARKSTERSEEV